MDSAYFILHVAFALCVQRPWAVPASPQPPTLYLTQSELLFQRGVISIIIPLPYPFSAHLYFKVNCSRHIRIHIIEIDFVQECICPFSFFFFFGRVIGWSDIELRYQLQFPTLFYLQTSSGLNDLFQESQEVIESCTCTIWWSIKWTTN